jgi:hypothetical protein
MGNSQDWKMKLVTVKSGILMVMIRFIKGC